LDPSIRADDNPFPLPQLRVRHPVGAPFPVRSVGGAIERLDHLPVCRHFGSRSGPRIVDPLPRVARRQIGPVAGALPRRPAVVDHSVGQKGIVARNLLDPHIALGRARSVFTQDGVDLMPPSGRNLEAGHRVGQHPGVPVVDVQLKDTRTVIDFAGVDQGQVATVLFVLPESLYPGAF